MKTKILSAFMTALVVATGLQGQTVQWAVRPMSASIEGYGELLKIRRNGKCGLIDKHGKNVVAVEYDSISPFRDGYALLMNRSGRNLKIEAVMSDGEYDLSPVSEDIFATRYNWFSDGKMPVKGDGGWGYLGVDGNMAIPCMFERAFPFSEGYASVMIDDKAYYINRSMDYLNVEAGYGDLIFASTFSGNEAVVYSVNRKGYVINQRGRIVRPYKVKAEELKPNRYDHSVGDNTSTFKSEISNKAIDDRYQVFHNDGKYGYKMNGREIISAQFDKAEPVRGGYANVVFKGQNGVLRFLDGSFSVQMEQRSIKVTADNRAMAFLQLTLPKEYEDAAVRIRISDSEHIDYVVQAGNSSGVLRNFSFRPLQLPQKDILTKCSIGVWADDLLLWTGSVDLKYLADRPKSTPDTSVMQPTVSKPSLSIASLSVAPPREFGKRAQANDDFLVKVTVTNKGDARGNASVTLFIDDAQAGVKKISVPGHGISNAIFTIHGIKKERFVKAKACLKDGRHSQEARLHFIPFY